MVYNYETPIPPKVYDGPPPQDALQMENGDWVWRCECGKTGISSDPRVGAFGCQPPSASRMMSPESSRWGTGKTATTWGCLMPDPDQTCVTATATTPFTTQCYPAVGRHVESFDVCQTERMPGGKRLHPRPA